MIYKAFLNRQEITEFPVKGKDVSKIYGGNTLLWEKEQIKEAFSVRGAHIYDVQVTNGKQYFAEIKYINDDKTSEDVIASFSEKKPFINALYRLSNKSNRYICCSAEENGYVCVTEIENVYNVNENGGLESIKSMNVTINGFKGSSNFKSPVCVISAAENESYIIGSYGNVSIRSAITWQNQNHIFLYAKCISSGKVYDVVFKINFNGIIVERYRKRYDSSNSIGALLNKGTGFSTIYSGTRTFIVDAASNGYNYTFELKTNPFEMSKFSDGTLKRYIGKTGQKHVFVDTSYDNKQYAYFTNIYKLENEVFTKIRTTYLATYKSAIALYNNHLIFASPYKTVGVIDCGDIETGTDDDKKVIYRIPFEQGRTELAFVQSKYLYMIYYYGTSEPTFPEDHYMTVIPL